jgi:CheY-like chemotaxis protein
VRTYVVEPQQIFVPSLLQLLQESGFSVVRVTNALDPLDVMRARPRILFCDNDAPDEQLAQHLRFLLDSMPDLGICLYSRLAPSDTSLRGSARLVHVAKSAPDDVLRSALEYFAAA